MKSSKTCFFAVWVVVACCGTATAATRAQWSFNGTVGTTFVEGDTIPDVSASETHPLSIGRFSMGNWEIQWRTPSIMPFMAAPNNACRRKSSSGRSRNPA